MATMTVEQLVDGLLKMPQDAKVMLDGYDSREIVSAVYLLHDGNVLLSRINGGPNLATVHTVFYARTEELA